MRTSSTPDDPSAAELTRISLIGSVDTSILRTLALQDGTFLRADALALGLDDRVIRRLIKAGEWHRVRRGAYCFSDLWAAQDNASRHRSLTFATVRSARAAVVASHVSAAHALRVPVWDLDESDVHLTVLNGRGGRRESGVCQHQGWLGVEDVTIADGRLTTSGTRTALDVARTTDVEHAMVVMSGLLRAGHTTLAHLERRNLAMQSWPHNLGTALVIQLANGRFESVGEARTFYHCWSQHLPPPTPQFEIWHSGRCVAYLDFAWPALGVWVEFDGKVKYQAALRDGQTPSDAVVREKKREDLIREITGWVCVRITWADLFDPGRMADRIRRAFALRSAA